MQNFQDTFETRKRSFMSAFSICVTVPLNNNEIIRDVRGRLDIFQLKHH